MINHLLSIVSLIIIVLAFLFAYRKNFGVTLALLFSNFAIFIISSLYPEVIFDLGFKPTYLYGNPTRLYTLVTTMFLHADLSHILGNMITLFFLGIPFERRVGWKKFSLIYFISGMGGAVLYSIINPKPVLLIGASGAIFGILGAFALAYPFDEIIMPLPVFFVAFLTRIKVIYAAIFFGFLEIAFSFFSSSYDNVAHVAHIGGLLTGIGLSCILLKERKVKIGIIEYRSLEEASQDLTLINKIRFESIPEVKNKWMEEFIKRYRCPYCGGKLKIFRGEIYCKKCDFIFR